MKRYKRYLEGRDNPHTRNAIPNKDGITELNIIQIIALSVIDTRKTDRLKTFLYSTRRTGVTLYFSHNQKKLELDDYLNKINSQDARDLWKYVINELSTKGFVTKRGSITNSGNEELQKVKDEYADGYSVIV